MTEKKRFEEYDTNKDGFLSTHEEWKAWLVRFGYRKTPQFYTQRSQVPDVQQTAYDEAGHLFSQTDDNNDGKLSIAEIVAKHEVWVGSEATGYGEHLRDEL